MTADTSSAPLHFEQFRSGRDLFRVNPSYRKALADADIAHFESFVSNHRSSESPAYEGRSAVYRLRVPGIQQPLLHRHYERGGVMRLITRDLYGGRPRPFREIEVALKAGEMNIRTCPIMAARVHYVFGPFHRADILVGEIENANSLGDLLLSPGTGMSPRFRHNLMKELGTFLAHLHDKGLYHPDLHFRNILFDGSRKRAPDRDDFVVIDLDRVRVRHPLTGSEARRNLCRFLRFGAKYRTRDSEITETDFVRLIHSYTGARKKTDMAPRSIYRSFRRGIGLHRLLWSSAGREKYTDDQ